MDDAIAAADATGAEEVSIIGFCMGGMYTLKAAGTGRFWRAAAFYGMIRVPEQWQSATNGEPLDALASPDRCPTMAIIGTEDPWTPPADVDALEAAGVDVVRYEGAEHGFVHDPEPPRAPRRRCRRRVGRACSTFLSTTYAASARPRRRQRARWSALRGW